MSSSPEAPALDKVKTSEISLLIVDDEEDFRDTAYKYFRRLGFQVDQAEDGEEALNVTTNQNFDVVVLDIHMPGMSGLDVLEEVRVAATKLPVILMTGRYDADFARRSLDAGASAFLRKPFEEDELLRAIEVAIRDRR